MGWVLTSLPPTDTLSLLQSESEGQHPSVGMQWQNDLDEDVSINGTAQATPQASIAVTRVSRGRHACVKKDCVLVVILPIAISVNGLQRLLTKNQIY